MKISHFRGFYASSCLFTKMSKAHSITTALTTTMATAVVNNNYHKFINIISATIDMACVALYHMEISVYDL